MASTCGKSTWTCISIATARASLTVGKYAALFSSVEMSITQSEMCCEISADKWRDDEYGSRKDVVMADGLAAVMRDNAAGRLKLSALFLTIYIFINAFRSEEQIRREPQIHLNTCPDV